jgi:hypothetical protein
LVAPKILTGILRVLERSGGARGSFRQKLVKEGGAALRDAGLFFKIWEYYIEPPKNR